MIRHHIALAAAALLIAGCGSPTPIAEQPAEAAVVAAAPAETDYLAQGKQQGYEAAVAAQNADVGAWASVAERWGWAINSLGLVPADHPDYATAQAKIEEYTANQSVATERHAAYEAKSRQTQLEVNQARAAEASPAPLNSYGNDPAAKALASYEVEIRKADPDGMIVTKLEGLGTENAAGVTVTEAWQLLPAVSRENNAQDLHKIWVLEVLKAGGSHSTAQILIFSRHGDTIARVSAGGVKLNE
ncbi:MULTISPECIES: hypothetical protein [Cyanophyceae]|uniref:hypothetical protein n=1 Tax=Cyanophyceae TaxID=3028117 RepID=UPI001682D6B7|nr:MULTISPECIES: hypothetical protein [Cyanophyceae]MBD1918897.1 hypothetical protein [Phormidium sp. FACHB-77]MBD2033261.1 hypothetical protein [Phormidium sp. FACHB-322]MBD2053806.1 hypothetical protein [Leptolyngbya sp. FACHB-60]